MATSTICVSATLSGWPRPASRWHVAREFAFAENTISLGHLFSIYNSLQVDNARTALAALTYGTGLTQSFSSIRFQPIHLLTFDLNHNYLRNLPTFDPALISTGLLDQYLFQGLSGGVRVELPYRIAISTDIGRSKSSADTSTSWNQMYGLTFGEIKKTGLQLDLRYAKFNSSFGQGTYEFVSVSRSIADRLPHSIAGGDAASQFRLQHELKFQVRDQHRGLVDWAALLFRRTLQLEYRDIDEL